MTCNACKAVRLKPIKRAKHFEICDKKPKTKGAMCALECVSVCLWLGVFVGVGARALT